MAEATQPPVLLIDGKLMNIGQSTTMSRQTPSPADSSVSASDQRPNSAAENLDVDSWRNSSGGVSSSGGDGNSSGVSSRLASPDYEESMFPSSEVGFRLPGSQRPHPGRAISQLATTMKAVGCSACSSSAATYSLAARMAALLVAVGLYNAYIVYAIHYHVTGDKEIDWCDGLGFLIVLTLLVYLGLFYFHVVKRGVRRYKLRLVVPGRLRRFLATRFASLSATLLVIAAVIVFLVLDSSRDRYRSPSPASSGRRILAYPAIFDYLIPSLSSLTS